MDNNIKQLRESFGLSQANMARVMGCPRSTWYSWEAERREPSGSAARLIDVYTTLSMVCPDVLRAMVKQFIEEKG